MENVMELRDVNLSLGDFQLKDFSLDVRKGFVTGFIGGNGVGKSTTIKLMMNLLQPDSGSIRLFGLNYKEHEKEIKQRIGFVYDENIFYENLTLKEMKEIAKGAYDRWDDDVFHTYVKAFNLPLNKQMKTFSKGMKMKASLAVALSHDAELIIMDEPTSGLDPIFRRELLGILHELLQDGEKTIFFSTHITTDLDSIADYITLIHDGQHVFTKDLEEIRDEFAIVKGDKEVIDRDTEKEFISLEVSRYGFQALTANKQRVQNIFGDYVMLEEPTLEEIMFYHQKGVGSHV
ncbi:sodium ABC transporter ATP-binding protein [Pontibacillus halophilus JSM 076056 = DSM 19796]|uniref:Sodium ABC transporter ATP-binding protein n=1 Tax=Pontibacillus halophilus JSM 076056 = DSM 19796 TaxID=1385510 RepID=A0A0A5GIX4_9BACI|nr:ABC transporter ATP-binding protein [Pontibacillus halophilus]KGX91090.1 sodium ABC transporter ATP-binding protein [Pontibacillus halophilus JSM 076056 = DSM 19796]